MRSRSGVAARSGSSRSAAAPSAPTRSRRGRRIAIPAARFARGVRALYLNRLAVVPERWGGGLGAALMRRVEARAREVGARAVRFDAFRDNAPLRAFYRRLGYVERGPFRVGAIAVVCLEKELSP